MLTSTKYFCTKFRRAAFNCPIRLSVETKLKRNKPREYNQKPLSLFSYVWSVSEALQSLSDEFRA